MSGKTHTKSTYRTQDGIVVGNVVDKSSSKGLSGFLVSGFDRCLKMMLKEANPISLHEVGCGEGRIIREALLPLEVPIQASDLSTDIIAALSKAGKSKNVDYKNRSIYDLNKEEDFADTIICCEVMEHLGEPEKALRKLYSLGARQYIFSVPNEPLWRFLNVCRLKYLRDLGNTPGHLNHWSGAAFEDFLRKNGFTIETFKQPTPWTMVRARLS